MAIINNEDFSEADIVVNGIKLTAAQSMTVRVAIEMFAMDLERNILGNNEYDMKLSSAYLRNIRQLRDVLSSTANMES